MKKPLIYSILLVLMVFCSCGESRSKSKAGIISEKEMVSLLVETHIIDAILVAANESATDKQDKGLFYYPSILERHGITKASMDSSVVWYMKHPDVYARIYEEVIKELDARKAALKKDLPPE